MRKPLAIDIFCGLGGWTEGLLAEGWNVVGFDIERHVYGEHRYPSQLVLQDVLTIHGRQFKDADLIVASPPCQEYSYMAMPWSKAKEKRRQYEAGERDVKQLTALFDACFRIQREASDAAGRHIPLVVENVRGAQRWVGKARWNFGSFYLWGDVPALMPIVKVAPKIGDLGWQNARGGVKPEGYKGGSFNTTMEQRLRAEGVKNPGFRFDGSGRSMQTESVDRHVKVPTDRRCDCGHLESEHGFNPDQPCNLCSCINPVWVSSRRTDIGNGARFTSRDCGIEGVKQGGDWFNKASGNSISRRCSSKSKARKHAAAMIAKIPEVLSRHIARIYYHA